MKLLSALDMFEQMYKEKLKEEQKRYQKEKKERQLKLLRLIWKLFSLEQFRAVINYFRDDTSNPPPRKRVYLVFGVLTDYI